MTTRTDRTDSPEERERADLAATLHRHRGFLRQTVRGLDDAAARSTPTASSLSLASLLKHVADTEEMWIGFCRTGSMPGSDGWTGEDTRFVLGPEHTLEALLARYDEVAAATDAFLDGADLGVAHPLPAAPWFEPGASWTVRRVLWHVLAETAQHAGHADIIRETLDGARTMG
ncbi:DinB family protein [Nocardioides sp. TRM66260-LWL]|uniref:DinB family protein n=1 Tax=Nocardioides sp. TRM66260-LWL TaxID=2874478 RepID=UPI001CC4E04E|nr:DinB family protein [Nocardioides sp. TRM66260-LWL]MBZ5734005.1 DinB family protein [Nocardioides sp. TRM66260-LWL]